GEVDRDGLVHPRAGGDHREPGDGEAADGADRGPQPAGGDERTVGEVGGQAAQDEDEDDERDRLDEHLGEREVRGAVELVEERDPVAGDTDEQDGLEATAGPGGEQRRDDDDGDDRGLDAAVPQPHVLRQRGEREGATAHERDRRDEDGRQVGGQGASLGEGRDVGGQALGAEDDPAVPTGGSLEVPQRVLQPLDPLAPEEQDDAGGDDEEREVERRAEPAPQGEVPRLAGVGLGVGREDVLQAARQGAADDARDGEDDGRGDDEPGGPLGL